MRGPAIGDQTDGQRAESAVFCRGGSGVEFEIEGDVRIDAHGIGLGVGIPSPLVIKRAEDHELIRVAAGKRNVETKRARSGVVGGIQGGVPGQEALQAPPVPGDP
jgi:hypothetical protein